MKGFMFKNLRLFISAGALCSVLSACCSSGDSDIREISIDVSKKYQTIENFAASDAWSGNFVGQHFNDEQKSQIAKWLFSQELGRDGNPQGIGLSLWRVNLGAGTLEQDAADILPTQRRAESFLSKDGASYDWNKLKGQRYFMAEAKKLGCDNFLLFSNSPPVQWTRNGKGYGEKNYPRSNLKPDSYAKFALYMADSAAHLISQGFNVSYISPINEPQVPWNSPRQEGSMWTVPEMYKIFAELDAALSEKKLDGVKILVGEAARPEFLYRSYADKKQFDGLSDIERPDMLVEKFFDEKSQFYLGKFPRVSKCIAAHAYHFHLRNAKMRERNSMVRKEVEKYGIGYQQSEWCLLPNYKAGEMDGFTVDWNSHNRADIQTSLLLARIIHSDFTDAFSSAWGYWKAMEIKGDHALIGVFPKDGKLESGGVASANKLLWALGNYSLFIRPGYVRVSLEGADDLNSLAASAYISPDGKRLVAVFVNSSFDSSLLDAKFIEKNKVKNMQIFRTDRNSDLARIGICEGKRKFFITPRSITTVVFDLE